MGRLNGKIAVVTGGARGMGAAHVRKLSEEGAKVVFTDVLVHEGQALAEELGQSVRFIKHDVANAADWDHVIKTTENTFGPVNILVNNAGIVILKPIDEITEEEYRKIINVNQIGTFLGMKSVLPSMRKTTGGSIINISSVNGMRGNYGSVAYDASKFAVRGMTKTAAIEFGQYGIRVNSIHPGVIETPFITQGDTSGAAEEFSKGVPLKRIAQPEEVSNLVLFLASDESSYSTGAEFIIDGGMTAKL